MRMRAIGLVLCGLIGWSAQGHAQVAWDAPTLIPPQAPAGTGIYLVDAHRGGLGVLGAWRGAPFGSGFRLGVADGRGDNIAVFGGIDVVSPLVTASPDFPLDLSWFAGVGAGYSEWLVLSVPVGLTAGRTFAAPEVSFTPYLAPKLIVDAEFDRAPDNGSELDLNLAVDLGIDLQFQPGWLLRVGAGLGGRSALAVGIVF